jgi:hypothetical protein
MEFPFRHSDSDLRTQYQQEDLFRPIAFYAGKVRAREDLLYTNFTYQKNHLKCSFWF